MNNALFERPERFVVFQVADVVADKGIILAGETEDSFNSPPVARIGLSG